MGFIKFENFALRNVWTNRYLSTCCSSAPGGGLVARSTVTSMSWTESLLTGEGRNAGEGVSGRTGLSWLDASGDLILNSVEEGLLWPPPDGEGSLVKLNSGLGVMIPDDRYSVPFLPSRALRFTLAYKVTE